MPGSKRGEHRGAAKPGHLRKPGFQKGDPSLGRRHGSKAKPKLGKPIERGIVNILGKRIPLAAKERELEMYFMVTGKRMRLPKEVMLDAMRYCEEMAVESLEVYRANARRALEAKRGTEREVYNTAARNAETNAREYLLAAVDVAYKAAPFIHPRLAAFAGDLGMGDQNNSIARLLREIDEAGHPARYIDLDPREFKGREPSSD